MVVVALITLAHYKYINQWKSGTYRTETSQAANH